ncbi:MAG TPA: alpha/beta fold hydrolase [Mycobacteriales bacterium]|nr:alpha/beta fold hydrolase [Mycobacteriales bacterium]
MVVAAAGFAVSVPSSAVGVVPSAAHVTPTVHWGKCPASVYQPAKTTVKCAALAVPMDYNDPSGRTITLELSLLRHTSSTANYRGVMLSNPGGPGGSGIDLGAELEPAVPHGVGRDYDWVSWDPRGVGLSRPALHCQDGYFDAPRRAYTPSTKSLLHYWLARSKAYADRCERKYPQLLQNMTTVDSAMDMNAIREALGVAKISYYGFSYGTYLGQVYSTLFPTHLKYMVLDSNVDPRKVWYQANLDQDRAFNRNSIIYFRWVAKYDATYHLGSTERAVAKRFYATVATLSKHPDGKLGPDEWSDAFLDSGYDTFGWESLAQAWRAYALHGKTAPMLSQYRDADAPNGDNGFEVYSAVECTDAHWPTSWSRWRKDNDAYARKYPFLTWGNAWFNSPCIYWGAKAHKPVTIDGSATKSALLIDETLDAATPFAGSLEVRRLYPHSSLIAEPGGTVHAGTLDGDACVDDRIAAYLKSGARPSRKDWDGPDLLCKPLPLPVPKAASGNSRVATADRPSGRFRQ